MTCAAQHDVGVQLLAAQIEEAVFQPRVLGIVLVAEHRQRQLAPPGRAPRSRARRPRPRRSACRGSRCRRGRLRTSPSTRTTHSERSFSACGEGRRIRIDHALGEAVMVAQVDEQHAAMVADAVAPAGQADGLARPRRAPRRRRYGCDSVHVRASFLTPGRSATRRRAIRRPESSAAPGGSIQSRTALAENARREKRPAAG